MANFKVGRFVFVLLMTAVLCLVHVNWSLSLKGGADQLARFGILTAFLALVFARWRDARIHPLYLLLAPIPVVGQLVLFSMLIFKKRPEVYES